MNKSAKLRFLSAIFCATGLTLALNSCWQGNSDAEGNSAPATAVFYDYHRPDLTVATTPNHLGISEGVTLADNQEFNYYMNEPYSLDPTFATTGRDALAQSLFFDPLVRQARDGVYVPIAAQSWQVSADGLTWTFHLRPDATWSDGKPVTAADFVYAWQRLADPRSAAPEAPLLETMHVAFAGSVIRGDVGVDNLGVRAVYQFTFEVQLSQPQPAMLVLLSQPQLVPLRADVINQFGQEWIRKEHVVTNGPFLMQSYEGRQEIIASRNPHYWGGADLALNTVRIKLRADDYVTYVNFESGLTNLIDLLSSNEVAKAMANTGNPPYTALGEQYLELSFNLERVPDVAVREAVSKLVNTKEYVKIVEPRETTPVFQLVNNHVAEAEQVQPYAWSSEPTEQVIAQANQALQQAGYSASNPLHLKLLVSHNNPIYYQALQHLFDEETHGVIQLEQVGTTPQELQRVAQDRDYDLVLDKERYNYPHIALYLEQYTCARGYLSYCNEKFDELFNQASHSNSSEQRQQLYAQATQILMNDYVAFPLGQTKRYITIHPQLQGFNKDLTRFYFQDLYFVAQ